jgi:hypothetical protein
MMPWEPMKHESGHMQESFAVEMRSLGGYSGSPVFLYMMPLLSRVHHYPTSMGPWLMGVDWGHIISTEPVRNKYGDPSPDGQHVRSNSGMIGVVPAWKLQELLFREDFVTRRKNRENLVLEERAKDGPAVQSDAAPAGSAPPTTEENPSHREDFNSLVGAAAKTPRPK